jgi:hypothetical protein
MVLPIEPETFFQQDAIDVNRRAMLLDSQAFKKPVNLPALPVSQNIKISSKSSMDNVTKYLIKIENVEKGKPFLVQLNQTFGMSWKIKWVDKNYFEEKKCLSGWEEFPLSNNATCPIRFNLLDWKDFGLLFTPAVSNSNHFEGNFVGNSWLVKPQDIPKDLQNEKELYAVIVYEKQIYYIWILALAGLTAVVLVVLAVKEFAQKKFLTKKNNE